MWFACMVQFRASSEVKRRHRHGAWRHVGYQIAVFMILALSLRAFGMHEDDNPTELSSPQTGQASTTTSAPPGSVPTSAVRTATTGSAPIGQMKTTSLKGKKKHVVLTASELSAIMILFALAELAALLGKDVAQATDEIQLVQHEATLARTGTEQVRTSLEQSREEIVKSEGAIQKAIANLQLMQVPQAVEKMHTDVRNNVLNLLEVWSQRASHQHTTGDPLLDLAWRIFIREYVREEADDFMPQQLQTEGVPISAQPYPTVETSDGHFELKRFSHFSVAPRRCPTRGSRNSAA